MLYKLALIVILFVLIILPIIRMFIFIDHDSIVDVMNSPLFLRALQNSFVSASLVTIITLSIALVLAWCIQRTRIRFKGIVSIVLVLPMLIPTISHGMGLVILFGNNGVLKNLLDLDFSIYGMWGVIAGSVMYAFPLAFLMIDNVMKYEDNSPYEAAQVLGIPRWRQLISITLPYLRKPLISIVFAVFTWIVTDYGVPLMVGGKFTTLPVLLYQEVIGQLNFGRGSVYGVILLIPALIAFVIDVVNRDKGNAVYVIKRFELSKNRIRDVFSYLFCGLVTLIVAMPIFAFGLLAFTKKYPADMTATFNNIIKTLNQNGGRYFLNSIIIATFVSLIGVALAFVSAYATARMRSTVSKYLHLIALTSMAIPGVVLGLSYVLVFKGSIIYGTIGILIMVNLAHFFTSPYVMMYNSLTKINENLEAVGHTLGISRLRMIKDVFLPQSKATILEMISYFFINSMITISAVSFLATTSTRPVSLMINQFEAQVQLECAAVVSLAILFVNVLIKGTVYLIRRYDWLNSIHLAREYPTER